MLKSGRISQRSINRKRKYIYTHLNQLKMFKNQIEANNISNDRESNLLGRAEEKTNNFIIFNYTKILNFI